MSILKDAIQDAAFHAVLADQRLTEAAYLVLPVDVQHIILGQFLTSQLLDGNSKIDLIAAIRKVL